jgi:hypothetical protein
MSAAPLLPAQFILRCVLCSRQWITRRRSIRRAGFSQFDEFKVAVFPETAPEGFSIEFHESNHGGILAEAYKKRKPKSVRHGYLRSLHFSLDSPYLRLDAAYYSVVVLRCARVCSISEVHESLR